MVVTSTLCVRRYETLGSVGGMVMFKKVAVTMSVVAGIMLAIALAPNVPTALATAHVATSTKDTLQQPLAEQSCAAFEAWFLDPACSKPHTKKKAARTKHHNEG
jgi:Na+/H+-dicarboxylate symporter